MTNKELKRRLAELYKKTGYMRKLLGPKAYSQANVLEWVKTDLNNGHYIEAYAITDQYIDTLLKQTFCEIFENSSFNKRFTVEYVLRCGVIWHRVNKSFLELYRDFKSTRDDLIHKSIFNQQKAKELENTRKIKDLPIKVIQITESFFENDIKEYFKNLYTEAEKVQKEQFVKVRASSLIDWKLVEKKMIYLTEFKIRILMERQNFSRKKTTDEAVKYLKDLLIKLKL